MKNIDMNLWPTVLVVGIALLGAVLLACGEGADDSADYGLEGGEAAMAAVAADTSTAAPAPAPAGAFAAPAATPAPIVAAASDSVVAEEAASDETAQQSAGADGAGEASPDSNAEGEQATLVQQQRIVVRTVDMSLVVADIQSSMDGVASVAASMGGWTVSSSRGNEFSGNIAVRVPAARLDEAIARMRLLAAEVESEITTSKDVTDEYFDSQARLNNYRATETAMLKLLEQAENARDALEIQKELFNVQEDIERLLGTLKRLEETAAFSLMRVSLQLQRVDLAVNVGADLTVNVGQTVRFKATFQTTDESSEYLVKWDFGDNSEPIYSTFTAPTSEPGTRVTAAVQHVFGDHRDSPYFVEVRISGSSESSPLFGRDTVRVTVVDTEQMQVDGGEDQTGAVGRIMRFRAFFVPPDGIDEFSYTWDFGDGSNLVGNTRVILTEDSSRMVTAVASHVYQSAEESPYIVQIKMVGTGEAGSVRGSDKIVVTVTEAPVINVSAGESITVEAGASVRLRGTFNRPDGVRNMRYRWEFGDGTSPVDGALDEGNSVEVEHRYILIRADASQYTAKLTVTGDSEGGLVTASSEVVVTVIEGEGWIVGGYDLTGTTKAAVRSLSALVRALTTAAIWVIVFSPFWGGCIAIAVVLGRRSARRRAASKPQPPVDTDAERETPGDSKPQS